MSRRSLAAVASLVSFLFPSCLWADLIEPRLLADFRDGEPQLTIAPGEKRFGRSTLPGDLYRKHPYHGHANRISLKSVVATGDDCQPHLRLLGNMAADVLGAFNPQSGTLSGWFRTSAAPSEDQPLLSVRGGFMESYPGVSRWVLGLRAGGGFYLTTPAVSRCEAPPLPDAPEGEWVHLAAVWDRDAGVRLYMNGKLAASQWQQGAPEDKAAPLFDTVAAPQAWRETLFSRGTGERERVGFSHIKEWKDDSVEAHAFPEGEGLVIEKESAERLQVRTRRLISLPPGRYELIADVRGEGGAGGWAPRLSIRANGETRLLGASSALAGGSRRLPFEITEKEGDAEISLDLNFSDRGRYELRRLLVRHALAESVTLSPTITPVVADRLFIHANPEMALRDLRVYDLPLSADGVEALFAGRPLGKGMVEQGIAVNSGLRLASLAWDHPSSQSLPAAHPGKALLFRQAPVLEARENRRAAGWLPVSGFVEEGFPWGYHGYDQGVDRELHLELGFTPNWMTGSAAAFDGSLWEEPFRASGASFGRWLDVDSPKLSFHRRSGSLSHLGFYHVSEGALPGGVQAYPLWTADADALAPINKRELLSAYPPAERQVVGAYYREAHPLATLPFPALHAIHFASPKVGEEYALGGLGLRLRMAPLSSPRRARLVVHDPSSPWRELARVECTLEPKPGSGNGEYIIILDLRDTILLPGSAAWVSVTFDEQVDLRIGHGGSELFMMPAEDPAQAASLWREWELRSIRDRVERLSEPRPWGDVGLDGDTGWWLAVSTPVFEQISRGLERLRTRFPEDREIAAYHAFTHPRAPSTVRNIPLPSHQGHPEWAVLARECLRQYKVFVDFWIDQRQLESGELGHFYGDDTDLVQDWLDLTFIADPTGKYADSLGRLAHGIAQTFKLSGGRDGPGGKRVNGEPILRNGLNVRWTDTLHAYEEGLNVQPPDFIAHYGDPVRFQRLLDTVSRYDGFLLSPEADGVRRFPDRGQGAGFVNTLHHSGGPNDKYWHLMLHAGLVTAWYNGDPAVWSILEAVARGELQASGTTPAAAASLLQAVFRKSGKVGDLAPFMDIALWKSQRVVDSEALAPNTWERLQTLNRSATLAHLSLDAGERYASHPSAVLGWGDNRHLRNWLEWKFSGDEEYLVGGLRELYRDLVSLMPMRTVAEQSGDRVSLPKQLISQLYLGGVPGSRNRHFQPDFAVSYRGLDDNFAARVLENRPRSLQVELYSFAETAVSGELRVWGLEPGEYRIVQKNTEGKEEAVSTTRFLRRGDGFPITLPSTTAQRVTVTQIAADREPPLLGDAALSASAIRQQERRVIVPVYNLGVVPLRNLTVTLRNKDGESMAEKPLAQLPGVVNCKLGQAVVTFESAPDGVAQIEVSGEGPEITTRNNRVEWPPSQP